MTRRTPASSAAWITAQVPCTLVRKVTRAGAVRGFGIAARWITASLPGEGPPQRRR